MFEGIDSMYTHERDLREGAMAIRIMNNVRALNAWRAANEGDRKLGKSIQRLSSGLRINTAADDAAGLAISEKLRANIRGRNQANQNIMDGISVVQTADGALQEISAMLSRTREMAVQAGNTGTMHTADIQLLQDEFAQLVVEVDRVADQTEFNGRKILGGSSGRISELVESLRKTWLEQSEILVQTHYGLQGDGGSLTVVADQSAWAPAYVQGVGDGSPNNTLTNLELHVNLSYFDNLGLPNGGSGNSPVYLDRVIAHEMTHAVMMRSTRFSTLPQWFIEGAAEFIAGADERLSADLGSYGVVGVVNEIDSWEQNSVNYSAGYAAVKYLDSVAVGGIRGVMDRLNLSLTGDTLDQAIVATTGYGSLNAFLNDFKSVNGQNFILGLNLADADVGNIGGTDSANVVPDIENDTWDPLSNFAEIWPSAGSTQDPIGPLQVGPNAGHTIDLPDMQASAYGLGITGLNFVTDINTALRKLDIAINSVSTLRSRLGATQARLETSITVNASGAENLAASESRIRDLDIAQEMVGHTRNQILVQGSMAMLAQASTGDRGYVQILLN